MEQMGLWLDSTKPIPPLDSSTEMPHIGSLPIIPDVPEDQPARHSPSSRHQPHRFEPREWFLWIKRIVSPEGDAHKPSRIRRAG